MVLVLLLLLVSYSCLAGIVEGFLYGKKGAESISGNEHTFFVAKIAAIALIVVIPVEYHYFDRLILVACWVLLHAFFHDGCYYETRKRIDVAYYHFFYDKSLTSTARLEIGIITRSLMAIAGVLGITLYLVYL